MAFPLVPDRLALVEQLRRLPPEAAEEVLCSLSVFELEALAQAWREFWGRPDQIAPPGKWKHWLLCGGRGAGKTQALTCWVIERARGGFGPIRLIAGTLSDVRITLVEGESGILANSPPDFMPEWDPSADDGAGLLTWANGVTARGFSAERPKRLRGKQSRTDAYDDLAGFGPRAKETYDMAQFGLRVWGDCRAAYTTSPEDAPVIVHLMEGDIASIVRTYSVSDDNLGNLSADFLGTTLAQYAGTELEAQERGGVLIRKSQSSPYRGIDFTTAPVRIAEQNPIELEEIAIGVDPAMGAGPKHDEWGVVVVGRRFDRHLVTMEDLSDVLDSDAAGTRIIDAAERWAALAPRARITLVVEVNRGEDRIRSVLDAAYYKRRSEAQDRGAPLPRARPDIVGVKAKEGKLIRAGDVRPLFTTGVFHHVPGLTALEAQALAMRPDAPKRPRDDDRVDAEVHAAHYLANLGAEPAWAPPVLPARPPAAEEQRAGGSGVSMSWLRNRSPGASSSMFGRRR